MSEKLKNFKMMNLITKIAYILVAILFIKIPFTGLVLESLNINVISFDMIFALNLLTIVVSLLAKQWKLAIIATIGSMIIWAITLGISEVMWYYLKELFWNRYFIQITGLNLTGLYINLMNPFNKIFVIIRLNT